jgi:hypothetical protein
MATVLRGPEEDVALCCRAADAQDGLPRKAMWLREPGPFKIQDWDGSGDVVPVGWSSWLGGMRRIDGESKCPPGVDTAVGLRILALPPGARRGALASALARCRIEEVDDAEL